MTVVYDTPTINARLQDVVNQIGAFGTLILTDSSSNPLVTIALNNPAGTVSGGILTFSGLPLSAIATSSGNAAFGKVTSSNATPVSGLTVGSSTQDITLSPATIEAGQTVQLTAAQITGR